MNIKNIFMDSLVQLAILLSLLRTDIDNYLNGGYINYPEVQEIILGNSYALTTTQFHQNSWQSGMSSPIHPKSITNNYFTESIINNLENDFYENNYNTIISAYLVDSPAPSFPLETSTQATDTFSNSLPDTNNNNETNSELFLSTDSNTESVTGTTTDVPQEQELTPGSDLTKEDMDLIEVLWRQDLDMGVGREMFDPALRMEMEKERELEQQKLKEKEKELELLEAKKEEEIEKDPWDEIDLSNYTIDGETGELIALPPQSTDIHDTQQPIVEPVAPPMDINDGLLQLLNQTENVTMTTSNLTALESLIQNTSVQEEMENIIESAAVKTENQTSPDFTRQVSFEQRWADVATLLDIPVTPDVQTNNTNPLVNGLIQNTTFAPPINATQEDLPTSSSFDTTGPVTNMTTSPTYDLTQSELLFPNVTQGTAQINTTFNQPNSFLDDLLDDESLDGMDLTEINMETGMPSMPVDDTSSDSAVSSMGSSPIPPQEWNNSSNGTLSPFEGLEGASAGPYEAVQGASGFTKPKYEYFDSSSTYTDQGYQEASFNGNYTSDNDSHYNYSPAKQEHILHNHTYPLQPGQISREQRKKEAKRDKQNYGRDVKRAKQMRIPFTVDEIVNTPVEDFNELIQRYPLSENQLQLIRDIRRRGKNKVAAQNCRKRKLDVIVTLDDEVKDLEKKRDRLRRERDMIDKKASEFKNKFSHLYMEVFRSLRDENGHPYNPQEYSLQQTADGNVFLVPRNSTSNDHTQKTQKKRKDGKKE